MRFADGLSSTEYKRLLLTSKYFADRVETSLMKKAPQAAPVIDPLRSCR